ncbi:hypothetical protein AVEN_235125-1 [Araneus ventricosus]|uniref:Uncharacterized protein n=1 Tax=Araneus ventricosus TaxID=182803 RepID=A0A4Y2UV23_ARAVE|nr:hypothetical protein AVEN_235125-1 [Araneus ventricosus]
MRLFFERHASPETGLLYGLFVSQCLTVHKHICQRPKWLFIRCQIPQKTGEKPLRGSSAIPGWNKSAPAVPTKIKLQRSTTPRGLRRNHSCAFDCLFSDSDECCRCNPLDATWAARRNTSGTSSFPDSENKTSENEFGRFCPAKTEVSDGDNGFP